jgi:hypothetical protein
MSFQWHSISEFGIYSVKGSAIVYAERPFISYFGTVRTCLSHSPIPKCIQINRRGVQAEIKRHVKEWDYRRGLDW